MNNYCSVCGAKVENPNYCINCSHQFYADKTYKSIKDSKASKRTINRTDEMINNLLFLNRFIIIPLLVLTMAGVILLFIFRETNATVDTDLKSVEEHPIEDYIEEPPPMIEKILIPDFTNQTYEDLITDTELTAVFTFNVREMHNDEIPEGLVISQSPAPQREVNAPSEDDRIIISLVVSIGPEPVEIPEELELEIRFGRLPLLGREDNNPGLTLKVDEDIILTARINIPDLAPDAIVEWESSNEEIFEIVKVNDNDNTARIQALEAGRASLIARIGDREDRVAVIVIN